MKKKEKKKKLQELTKERYEWLREQKFNLSVSMILFWKVRRKKTKMARGNDEQTKILGLLSKTFEPVRVA